MIRLKADILKDLALAVVEMAEERAAVLAEEAIHSGIDPYEALMEGLSKGMEAVGRKYESGEYFIPQLVVCSDALYAGMEVIRPHLFGTAAVSAGRALIGVVEGDTHDIGKNLVRIMLESAGFEIHDLGRDVPLGRFVEEAEKLDVQMICMSSLMTTAMGGMEEVMRKLHENGLGAKFKVMVGGGPVSRAFADRIGADGYAPNAAAAVREARLLLSSGKE